MCKCEVRPTSLKEATNNLQITTSPKLAVCTFDMLNISLKLSVCSSQEPSTLIIFTDGVAKLHLRDQNKDQTSNKTKVRDFISLASSEEILLNCQCFYFLSVLADELQQ